MSVGLSRARVSGGERQGGLSGKSTSDTLAFIPRF
jgi:hypothetical protein